MVPIPRRDKPKRVLLIGMECAFTLPFLSRFISAPDADLVGVVLGRSAKDVSTKPPGPMLDAIETHRLQLTEVDERSQLASPTFRAKLESIAPDVVFVACFPWRLPPWSLTLPPLGCINVHPSLLPDGRGPEPVFWAFRWRLPVTGVTLHLMDDEIDSGPIVAQCRLAVADDATISTLESSLSQLGAEMALEHLTAYNERPHGRPQDHSGATRYARNPLPDDLIVPTSWSARDAARYIRAVASTYGSLQVLVLATGQRLNVDMVLKCDDRSQQPEPVRISRNEISIQFTPGVLICSPVREYQPLHIHDTGD